MDIQALEQALLRFKECSQVPSFSMTFYHEGTYHYICDGFVEDVGTSVTEDTLYGIASCSKSLIAGTIGTLVDRGLMKLDDRVRDIMPEFTMYDPYVAAHLTVRDILCHRSGLQRHDLSCFPRVADMTEKEIVDLLRYLKPNQPIRYKWQYSNHMFVLAGMLISRVSGHHWQEVMKKNIFEPLGIERAAFSPEEAVAKGNCATPYIPDPKTGAMQKRSYMKMPGAVAAAGIYMSSKELAKWNVLLLEGGCYDGHRVLSKEMCQEMISAQIVINQPLPKPLEGYINNRGYGLGMNTEVFREHRVVGHSGEIGGFTSYQFLLPDDGSACAVVTNAGVSLAAVIMRFIACEYLLGGSEDWGAILRRYFEQEAKKRTVAINRKKEPKDFVNPCPVSLDEVCGQYCNPGYGEIDIKVRGEALVLDMYDVRFTASHQGGYYFSFEIPQLLPKIIFDMELHTNKQTEIIGVGIGFDYETNEKIYFERISEPDEFDAGDRNNIYHSTHIKKDI